MKTLIAAILLLMAFAFPTDGNELPRPNDVVFQSHFDMPAGRQAWSQADFATWETGSQGKTLLCITVPVDHASYSHMVRLPLDLTRYRGCELLFECMAKADNVSKPPSPNLGVKFMLHYQSKTAGPFWQNENNVDGTFDWRKLRFVVRIDPDATDGEVYLGLQESSGAVRFDAVTITVLQSPLDEAELLKTADERIRKYRMADAEIVVVAKDKKLLSGAKVTIEQTRHEFLFGCNIFMMDRFEKPEMNQRYLGAFSALFNYATLPFYWGSYEPEQGKPNTGRLEQMAKTARAAGIELKGHPLVWHEEPCAWWPDDTAAFEKLVEARVQREVGHFAGLVDRWDVVNEAAIDAVSVNNAEGRWVKELGPARAVARALQWARAANPKAILGVNDSCVDEEYVKLLRGVRENGGSFDTIGLESHMHAGAWSLTKVWDVCERFKGFGVPLHFTETTVLSGPWKTGRDDETNRKDWRTTPEGEAVQADYIEKFYTILFSHPSVGAITWWDFSDRGAWMEAPAGLVRADLTPKPAYDRLMKLIKGQWWTTLNADVSADGRMKFRGFLGDYRVTLKLADGRTLEKTFRLERGEPNRVILLP